MKKIVSCFVILMSGFTAVINAQTSTDISTRTSTDTLVRDIRRSVSRNFSAARTFNLYWETSPNHDYTFKRNGQEIENGKMHHEHTVKFETTIPVLLLKKISIYANGRGNFYQSETDNAAGTASSGWFTDKNNYSYFKGTLSGTYRTRVANKPLILTANLSGDGWHGSFEKIQGSFLALVVFKHTATTSFSTGMYGITLFNQIPVFPIISYQHSFNPNLSVNVILPIKVYLRYQFCNNHRLSVGTSLESEQFYLKPNIEGLPKVCYFEKTAIKSEISYEYIINKHFYLIARSGMSSVVKSGIYATNRKGINGNPFIEYTSPVIPFFSLGISFNLFN